MKKILYIGAALLIALCWSIPAAMAGPDLYPGDTSIYGGIPVIQPNLLIILDTSISMNDDALPGAAYNGSTTYTPASYTSTKVYKCTAWGNECGNWVAHIDNVSSVTTSCGSANPRSVLLTNGIWNSSANRLTNSGACSSGSGIYATGNWINWRAAAPPARAKIAIARDVLKDIVNTTYGVRIGLMIFDGNQGGDIYSATVSGSTYKAEVKDMDAIFTGSTTNRSALVTAIDDIQATSWTPLAESLYEAMNYYKGAASSFSHSTFTSPIQGGCQNNFIVIITDGMSTGDASNVLQTICNNGDCDGDGFDPANDPAKSYNNSGSDFLDDVAWYMNHNDMSTTYTGTQNVVIYTVGFGLGGSNPGAVKLLNETAQNGSGGNHFTGVSGTRDTAFLTNDQTGLTSAMITILADIFEVNSSFVAPVVPVSPENRTYSGSRIYMGFFKPQSGKMWLGNLKKYGLDSNGNVVDRNNAAATSSDGSFLSTAVSYWSGSPDGGNVESGGVGELLVSRDLTANPRQIYTYFGTNTDLTHSSNAFTVANTTGVTMALLGMTTATDRDDLIKFVHGTDVYDDNANANKTENREWLLGDVLHSRPLVVRYGTYSEANEGNCGTNTSVIFVGANDGMLHAFKDCNGQEAWAFLPPDLLGQLSYLHGAIHAYFVDTSASPYIYDANQNGVIESGDRVVIVFGERRGGGKDTAPTGGFYYALDVTNPLAPVFLWSVSNTQVQQGTTTTATTTYGELAETWSEPKITKINLSTGEKIVAFVGAGYDNLNEDGRYGATQTYTGTGVVSLSNYGEGVVTSTGTSAPLNPKGRGVYAIEIASLSAGVPSFSAGGAKVWGYTNASDSGMTFSIPSEITALDTDYNGYVDRLYVGDTGGNIWRFDVGSTSTGSWAGKKIFSINPGSGGAADKGRKIFYRPASSLDAQFEWIFEGTGDREHPLNRAVVDRMYAFKDRDQATTKTESDMTDVTLNLIQTGTSAQQDAVRAALNATTNYGWYIKLTNSGEKVLATPTLFNGVDYFTTFSPNTLPNTDPCMPGNLGMGRLYAVDYANGGAVIDFTGSGTLTRGLDLGEGIPSGVVLIISSNGDVTAKVAEGGKLVSPPTAPGGMINPLYWRIR